MDALKLSYQKTGVLPPALANQPDITPEMRFYFGAFNRLSRSRTYHMSGPNPIALSEISAYAEKIGYTNADDFFFLADVISACDEVFLEDVAKRQKAKSESKKPAAKKPSRSR